MRFAPLLLALLVGCTPFEEPSGPPDLPASVVRTFPEDDEIALAVARSLKEQ